MRVKEVLATTKSTVGIDIKEWSFCKWRSDKQKSFRFLVWDFAGQVSILLSGEPSEYILVCRQE